MSEKKMNDWLSFEIVKEGQEQQWFTDNLSRRNKRLLQTKNLVGRVMQGFRKICCHCLSQL